MKNSSSSAAATSRDRTQDERPSSPPRSLAEAKEYILALQSGEHRGVPGDSSRADSSSRDQVPGGHVYHVVDTRDDNALVTQAVVNFDFPKICAGSPIEKDGKSYAGTLGYYLDNSRPGNMFTGVLHVKTGQIDLFPLSPDRMDMIGTEWGQKPYSGAFHDESSKLISHPGQGGRGRVSHLQLIDKLADKNTENYVGFTMLDVRDLRRAAGGAWSIANDEVSMLYGASRSLNTQHIKHVAEGVVAGKSNAEAFTQNKGQFGFHLPVELKRHILQGVAETLGERHPWRTAIQSELGRDELAPNAYAIAMERKRAAEIRSLFDGGAAYRMREDAQIPAGPLQSGSTSNRDRQPSSAGQGGQGGTAVAAPARSPHPEPGCKRAEATNREAQRQDKHGHSEPVGGARGGDAAQSPAGPQSARPDYTQALQPQHSPAQHSPAPVRGARENTEMER